MSYEIPGFKLGVLQANSDLSAKQYTFVKVVNPGLVDANTTQGAPCLGVLQNKPKAGENVELECDGVTKMVAGAAITTATESRIMSDASGRAITAATAGSKVLGIALEDATAAGQIIAVKLIHSVF